MTRQFFFSLFLLFPMVGALQSIEAAEHETFRQKQITDAITVRNESYGALVPKSAGIVITTWPKPLCDTALQYLNNDSTTFSNPWYALIKGMLSRSTNLQIAEQCFSTALDAAVDNPGTAWLLFFEFNRYRLDAWADKALALLEKQMFVAGARSSFTITNQLMQMARAAKMTQDIDNAARLFSWAHRFNPFETASIISRAQIFLPFHPVVMVKTLTEQLPVVTSSWKAQLELFGSVYEFARRAFFMAVLLIVALLAYKHLPSILHTAAHRYPDRLSSSVRALLVSGVLVSLAAFGVIPFILFLSLILWRKLSRPERLLLGGAVALLALSPLDAAVMERLDRLRDPYSYPMRLSQSLDEAGDPYVTRHTGALSPHDQQENVGVGIVHVLDNLKNGDRSSALRRMATLSADHPDDPVIANVKGIIHVLDGSFDSAAACFRGILNDYPRDVTAMFNLSHCSVMLNDATTGMELLKKAAREHPVTVNNFIKSNDRYFSDSWPPLRRIMFPDYSPKQFWTWFFLPTPTSPSGWHDYWGVSFFGIFPETSLVLFIVLFIALLISPQFGGNKTQPRKQFECKYCGRITCRRCSAGIICNVCAEKTLPHKSSHRYGEAVAKISEFASHRSEFRNSIMNLFVPGSGSLLKTQPAFHINTTGILLSSIVYTYWYSLFSSVSLAWMTPFERMSALAMPLLFHTWCALYNLPAASRHLIALLHLYFIKERSADGTQRHPA